MLLLAFKKENYKKHDWVFWGLIVVTILYGLHARFLVTTKTVVDKPIRADAVDYYGYAYNLAKHNTYSRKIVQNASQELVPDALREPGFPFFAALFVKGEPLKDVQAVRNAQTLLQVFVLLFLSTIILALLGLRYGALAIFLVWLFPHLISVNAYFLSESLFTSLLMLSFCFLCCHQWRGDSSHATLLLISAGFLFGLAALTRPIIEYFPFLFLLYVYLFRRSLVKNIALFVVAFMVPVLLWKLRNLLSIGAWSDSTLLANALYHGSFPNFMFNGNLESLGFPYRYDPESSRVTGDVKASLSLIFERAAEKPGEYSLWYLFGKQTFFWRWDILAGQGDIFIYPTIFSPYYIMPDLQWAHHLTYLIHPVWVLLGIFVGVFLACRSMTSFRQNNVLFLFLGLMICYVLLTTVITAPFPRYSIPFKWMVALLAVYGLKEFIGWIQVQLQKK